MLDTIRDDTWNALIIQHIIPNSSPVVAITRLKDPPTWLKMTTTLEKPPTPTHPYCPRGYGLNYQSRGFEISRDLSIRRLMAKEDHGCCICLAPWRCVDGLISFCWDNNHSHVSPMFMDIYRQISNISRTKSQTLNASHLVLQLSLPNPLKSGIKSRMTM